MRFHATALPGLVRIAPEPHADARGHFVRVVCAETFAAAGLVGTFPQTSLSYNRLAGTLRGMHFQRAPHAETKLVRCARGAIYNVVVDLREGSPTHRRWVGFELSAENGLSLYVPPGLAHGFQTLTDAAEVAYAITPSHVPGFAEGVRPDDPALAIAWPLPVSVIAERDRTWPLL